MTPQNANPATSGTGGWDLPFDEKRLLKIRSSDLSSGPKSPEKRKIPVVRRRRRNSRWPSTEGRRKIGHDLEGREREEEDDGDAGRGNEAYLSPTGTVIEI